MVAHEDLSQKEFSLQERDLRGTTALMLVDLQRPDYDPLVVDFLSGQMRHRLKTGLGKSQPLARALGLKSVEAGERLRVFDATAGMGVDAFIMAMMGCHVLAAERSAVVFALLQDGRRRLLDQASALNVPDIGERLLFENVVSHERLAAMSDRERPDVVYLDPMYPEEGRSKSALPKKEMQIFRRLLGSDTDTAELFERARFAARERVVVKRPLYAGAIAGAPTHSFAGKTARFDMYLVK